MKNNVDPVKMGEALLGTDPVFLELTGSGAFKLCGFLQLALRHPLIPHALIPYEVVPYIIRSLAEQLKATDPYLAEVLEKQWGEELNSPARKSSTNDCTYSDLDDDRKLDIITNSIALSVAAKTIAQATGKHEEEVGKAVAETAVKIADEYKKDQINQVIKSMDETLDLVSKDADS